MVAQTGQASVVGVEKLKRDLVGRRISDVPDGYHRKGWYWEIESTNDLKNVKIEKVTKHGDDYLYDVHLILQGKDNQHKAKIAITYIRDRNGRWKIELIETKQLNIVRTNRYNKCITAKRTGWTGEYELNLTNRCDVSLVVGGIIMSESDGKWQKFSTVLEANSTGSVGGLFFVSVKEYKIYFIERPY
jgi:hypothetical protein